MKNKIIMNEKKYVESIIDSTTLPDNLSVGKYIIYMTKLCYRNGLSCKECIDYIISVMNKYDVSPVEYQEYIMANNVKMYYSKLKSGKMSPIKEIDNIPIYQSEIDFINKCDTNKQKKMLFTIYVLAKFTDKYGWVYQERTDLYKLANVSPNDKNGSNIIYELYKKNLIKLTKRVTDNKVGVNDIYIPDNDEDPVMYIENLEYIGNQYMAFISKDKIVCNNCGKIINVKKTTGRKPMYCDKCAKEMQLESKRNWWNKNEKRNLLDKNSSSILPEILG